MKKTLLSTLLCVFLVMPFIAKADRADTLPVVAAILEPVNYTAYQSTLHIRATVSQPGAAIVRGHLDGHNATGGFDFTNNIDTTIDLWPNYKDGSFDLQLTTEDSITHQTDTATVHVYKESSPFLSPTYTVDSGQIIDFKDNRLLTYTTGADKLAHYQIVHMNDGTTEQVILDTTQNNLSTISARLWGDGAIFFVSNKAPLNNTYNVYFWRNGALTNISAKAGQSAALINNAINSRYLVWTAQDYRLAVTDLATLTTIFATDAYLGDYSLNEDGLVAFSGTDPVSTTAIYTYNIPTGETKKLVPGGIYPEIYKQYVAYIVYGGNGSAGANQLSLTDGTNTYFVDRVVDSKSYTAYDGYLAYLGFYNGASQVFLRDSTGYSKRINYSSAGSLIDFLGPMGQLFYTDLVSLYYYDSTTANVRISGINGKTYYQNGVYYRALGRTLFHYTIPHTPVISTVSPAFGIAGTVVGIKGLHLSGATAVTFGGQPAASFKVNSDDSITAVVSSAGAGGQITVTTPAGTASWGNFAFYLYLPPDNFTIVNTDASCKGDANGAISISAKNSVNYYTGTLKGNGVDTSFSFDINTSLTALKAGTYQLCITANELLLQFQQCFTVVIKEPADLKLDMAVGNNRDAHLLLSGGQVYYVSLNGTITSTSDSELTLPLRNGVNQLSVSTDKLCQGTLTRTIDLDEHITAYPNPFDQMVTVNMPAGAIQRAVISIYDAGGKNVWQREYNNPPGTVNLDLSHLISGFYLLKLSTGQGDQIIKLMKK